MTCTALQSKNHLIFFSIAALLAGTANAGQPPDSVTSDSSGNTAMGLTALFELGSPICSSGIACYNTGAGAGSLYAVTTGTGNSAFGFQTLNNIQTGYYNTATGYRALLSNKNGIENTAVGALAMSESTEGSNNTAMGFSALQYTSSGGANSAFGYNALASNTSGEANVAVGVDSLWENRSGSDNIAIGNASGLYILGSRNIDIGSEGVGTDNGIVRIGTPGTQTSTYIAGIESTKLTGYAVYVTSSGKLGVMASSERYKTAIESMGNATDALQRLRPVQFHLKNDPNGVMQYGLIAEEVDKVYPELVIRDDKGLIQGVRYDELAPMLLNEIKKQHLQMGEMQKEVAELKDLNQSILSAMAKLVDTDQRVVMR